MTTNDKRYDEYRLKCAQIDGVLNIYTTDDGVLRGNYKPDDLRYFQIDIRVPTYLDDASIDAVVRKLDNDTKYLYFDCLALTVATADEWSNMTKSGEQLIFIKCLTATPEQKSEALCRTLIGGN